MKTNKVKSKYLQNKYDLDCDGTVDYEELERSRTMFELEIREEKQKRIFLSW